MPWQRTTVGVPAKAVSAGACSRPASRTPLRLRRVPGWIVATSAAASSRCDLTPAVDTMRSAARTAPGGAWMRAERLLEAFGAYLRDEANASPHTIKAYETDVRQLAEFLEARGSSLARVE